MTDTAAITSKQSVSDALAHISPVKTSGLSDQTIKETATSALGRSVLDTSNNLATALAQTTTTVTNTATSTTTTTTPSTVTTTTTSVKHAKEKKETKENVDINVSRASFFYPYPIS